MNGKDIGNITKIVQRLYCTVVLLLAVACTGNTNEFDKEEFLRRARDEHRWSDFEVEKFARATSTDELETLLNDPDWYISYVALRALTYKNKAKPQYLTKVFDEADFTGFENLYVTDLLQMVGRSRDPAYLPRLKELLVDPAVIPNTKMAAITAISAIPGEQSWILLIEATTNDVPNVRWAAARSISWRWDKPVFDVLSPLTKDNNNTVRKVVAEALGMLGDTCALADLITLCEDVEVEVCETAAWALGNLRDGRAEPVLKRLIKTYGKETSIAMEAQDALRKISGGPRTLSKEEMVQDDKIEELYTQLLQAMSQSMTPGGVVGDDTASATGEQINWIFSDIVGIYSQFPNVLVHRLRKTCESTRDVASLTWNVALMDGPIIEMMPKDAIDWSAYIGDRTEGHVFRSNAMGFASREALGKLLPTLKDICINNKEHLSLRRTVLREICHMHTKEAGQVLEDLALKLDQPELKKIAMESLERRRQNK